MGIHNIKFSSFDRITFDWNGRYGAKIFVRFNCLSTDFSRIKGVKGIPLRAQMETKTPMTTSSTASQQLLTNNNTFPSSSSSADSNSNSNSNSNNNEYVEQCYCKIKLFRDKVMIFFLVIQPKKKVYQVPGYCDKIVLFI